MTVERQVAVVRQEGPRAWRWTWHGLVGERWVELPSNTTTPTAEAAVDAARTAYPYIAVRVEAPVRRRRRRWRVLGLVLVVLLLLVWRHRGSADEDAVPPTDTVRRAASARPHRRPTGDGSAPR